MGRKRLDDPKLHFTFGIKSSQIHIIKHIQKYHIYLDDWLELQLDRYWQKQAEGKINVGNRITTGR